MGVVSLTAFERQLDRFGANLEKKAILFQKKIAFMVLGAYLDTGDGIRAQVGLLQLTPIDTGRAVGNYVVSVGSPKYEVVDGKFGRPGGGEANRSRAAARVQVTSVRALSALRLGESIFITNSLPYIMVLNDGATNRVAHHMQERAIENTKRSLARSA